MVECLKELKGQGEYEGLLKLRGREYKKEKVWEFEEVEDGEMTEESVAKIEEV